MSVTGFLNSFGCIPEVDMNKKTIELLDGETVDVFDLKGDDVKTHCRYCGESFVDCMCDRTEHVYSERLGGCKLCYEPFNPNGTGPSNSPILHWFINAISWFNRWVTNISNKHDIAYFEGFTERRKEAEDDAMRERTYRKIDNTWYLKPKAVWKKRADVNWLAVDKCGDSSFNWSGCVIKNNDSKKTQNS